MKYICRLDEKNRGSALYYIWGEETLNDRQSPYIAGC